MITEPPDPAAIMANHQPLSSPGRKRYCGSWDGLDWPCPVYRLAEDNANWERTAYYLGHEKDRLAAENAALREQIQRALRDYGHDDCCDLAMSTPSDGYTPRCNCWRAALDGDQPGEPT